jgi:hypothetical protein
MNDDQGMREEDAPVSAEMRAVRMAAYNIVAHIDEFGQFWDEDINAFDTATAQLSGMTAETSSPFDRDQLGRFVREAWVRWAETQPSPKASWLLPYDELSEPDKEADRQIGEAVARWVLIGHAARSSLTSAPDLLSVLRRIEPALAAEVNTRGDEDGKYAFPMRPLLGIVSGAIAKSEPTHDQP